MAEDDVEEPMEIEILPSTSNNSVKMKEKDNKSPSLPWYVLFIQEQRTNYLSNN